jgi:segregation and condensation protein B
VSPCPAPLQDTTRYLSSQETMHIDQLKPIVEAALLASSQPMTVQQLGALFVEEDEVDHEDLSRALEALQVVDEARGVELVEVASGYRYQVRQHVHAFVSRMWTEKPSRYSRALLETLALIAYRQPITRPEIEQIRGVVVSSNIIKTLEEREFIRVVGYRDVPGKPALFGTTRIFLDYFNLKSLDALPPLSEIRDLEDLNPQMQLGASEDAIPAHIATAALPDDDMEATDIAEATHDADAENAEPVLPHEEPADDVATASSTADEAENADVDDDAAPQDTEEFRA